jgi:hypothetical protein
MDCGDSGKGLAMESVDADGILGREHGLRQERRVGRRAEACFTR